MAKCDCPGKVKVHGVLRCRKHELKFFAEETDAVLQAMDNPRPPDPPPRWADKYAQHAAK